MKSAFAPRSTPANRFGALVAVGLAFSWLTVASPPLAAAPPNDDAIAARFLEALDKRTDVTAEQKAEVRAAVSTARESAETRDDALARGLAVLKPELRQALDGLSAEDPTAARETLDVLADELEPFLAATAADALARHLAERGSPAEALPRLEAIVAKGSDHTLGMGRVQLALARVQERLLRREEAAASYRRALADSPGLSPDRKAELERRAAELDAFESGSLDDVRDRMRFSQEQLARSDAGQVVRDEQKRIVDLLDKLIEEAEERESQGQSKSKSKKSGQGQGKGPGSGKPGEGGGEGKSPGGDDPTTGPAVRKLARGGPQSPWGQLRDKERDPAFSAIKQKFPARYQQLLEQYYKSFQEDRP